MEVLSLRSWKDRCAMEMIQVQDISVYRRLVRAITAGSRSERSKDPNEIR